MNVYSLAIIVVVCIWAVYMAKILGNRKYYFGGPGIRLKVWEKTRLAQRAKKKKANPKLSSAECTEEVLSPVSDKENAQALRTASKTKQPHRIVPALPKHSSPDQETTHVDPNRK